MAPTPLTPETDAYLNTTEWVSLCPLVMDYCKEEGEKRGAVYVTLIDEVNTAGVPRDKDNNSVCGAERGIKMSGDIHSTYIFVCF